MVNLTGTVHPIKNAGACRVNRIYFEGVTVDLFKSQHLTTELKGTSFFPLVFLKRVPEFPPVFLTMNAANLQCFHLSRIECQILNNPSR